METIGSALDRLRGLLGQSYILAGVLPVLVICLLSGLLLYALEPELPYWLAAFDQLTVAKQTAYSLAWAVVLFLMGFLFWSMNSTVRRWLEGSLPQALAVPLRRRQQKQFDRSNDSISELAADFVNFRRLATANNPVAYWRASLRAARNSAVPGSGNGQTVSPALRIQFESLQRSYELNALIHYVSLDQFRANLESELSGKSADELPELDTLQVEFIRIATYASARWQEERESRISTHGRRFAPDRSTLPATTLGNMAAAHVSAIRRRYGLNLERFWISFQKFSQADKDFGAGIEEARTRLDVSVSLTAAGALCVVLWPIVVFCWQGPLWLYLLSAAAPALGAYVGYRLCVTSARVFQAAVETVVDLYRFDLMKQFHLALPLKSDAERALWATLSHLGDANSVEVDYTHG